MPRHTVTKRYYRGVKPLLRGRTQRLATETAIGTVHSSTAAFAAEAAIVPLIWRANASGLVSGSSPASVLVARITPSASWPGEIGTAGRGPAGNG